MRFLILALAGLLALAAPASAATLTPAPADAQKAIAAASPGDLVVLAGTIPPLSITAKSGLSIDASAAQLTSVFIKGSDSLTWTGGKFTPADWSGALYVQSSTGVTIQGVGIGGRDAYNGVFFRDSTNVKLLGAKIEHARVAVNFLNVTGGLVQGSALWGSAIDGIDIAGGHKITVEYSTCAGPLLADDHHPDCVQMWTVANAPVVSDIIIRNNLVHGASQGLNLFSHYAWDGGANIVVDHNTIEISYPQAVAINNCAACVVSNNVVRTLPGAKWRASINLDATVKRTGNVVEAGAGSLAVIDPN